MYRKLPRCSIAFDIDGVFWRSPKVFPYTKNIIEGVQKKKIPFVLLTNGGGTTEAEKMDKLNKAFGVQIHPRQMILSHTPLRKHLEPYRDRLVLVAGQKNVHDVATHYGLKRVINVAEIIATYPHIFPYNSQHKLNPQRRDLKDIDTYHPSQVEAICILYDGECWGSEIQVIMDCLLYGKRPDETCKHPPIFFSNPDLVWTNTYEFPRFAQGIYTGCIRHIYQTLTKNELKYIQFGKPTRYTMEYARDALTEEAKELGYEGIDPKTCYMIGDNVNSDIMGGKSIGWNTILVKTGVYNDSHASDGNPTFKCENAQEAIDYIYSKHFK